MADRAPQSQKEADEVKLALNDLSLEEKDPSGAPAASTSEQAEKADKPQGEGLLGGETEKTTETAPSSATTPAASSTSAPTDVANAAPPSTVVEDKNASAPAVDEKKTEEKATAPTSDEKTEAPGNVVPSDGWPELQPEHPLAQFLHILPKLTEEVGYNEVYGVHLGSEDTFHTKLILQKFLRANANDLTKAKEQLLGTLKWRKEFKPLETLDKSFDKSKYGGLGYVVKLSDVPTDGTAIATFNLYGAVKDNKKTFGDFDSFIQWRVALMELTIQKLSLSTGTMPIPDYGAGPDPYQGYQIHDYMSVSFLRQDPDVKAASKRVIDVFSKYYPETLSRKFFVNVPIVMGWMFKAMSMLLSRETTRKFTVMSWGKELANELGSNVPEVYGGKGDALNVIGEGPKLVEEAGKAEGIKEEAAVDKDTVGLKV